MPDALKYAASSVQVHGVRHKDQVGALPFQANPLSTVRLLTRNTVASTTAAAGPMPLPPPHPRRDGDRVMAALRLHNVVGRASRRMPAREASCHSVSGHTSALGGARRVRRPHAAAPHRLVAAVVLSANLATAADAASGIGRLPRRCRCGTCLGKWHLRQVAAATSPKVVTSAATGGSGRLPCRCRCPCYSCPWVWRWHLAAAISSTRPPPLEPAAATICSPITLKLATLPPSLPVAAAVVPAAAISCVQICGR